MKISSYKQLKQDLWRRSTKSWNRSRGPAQHGFPRAREAIGLARLDKELCNCNIVTGTVPVNVNVNVNVIVNVTVNLNLNVNVNINVSENIHSFISISIQNKVTNFNRPKYRSKHCFDLRTSTYQNTQNIIFIFGRRKRYCIMNLSLSLYIVV